LCVGLYCALLVVGLWRVDRKLHHFATDVAAHRFRDAAAESDCFGSDTLAGHHPVRVGGPSPVLEHECGFDRSAEMAAAEDAQDVVFSGSIEKISRP
jgi:hypothetical protein